MNIDWSALGLVVVVALAAVVVLTTLFSFGTRSLSDREVARERGLTGGMSLVAAVGCYALCAAVVAYGIYLIAA